MNFQTVFDLHLDPKPKKKKKIEGWTCFLDFFSTSNYSINHSITSCVSSYLWWGLHWGQRRQTRLTGEPPALYICIVYYVRCLFTENRVFLIENPSSFFEKNTDHKHNLVVVGVGTISWRLRGFFQSRRKRKVVQKRWREVPQTSPNGLSPSGFPVPFFYYYNYVAYIHQVVFGCNPWFSSQVLSLNLGLQLNKPP